VWQKEACLIRLGILYHVAMHLGKSQKFFSKWNKEIYLKCQQIYAFHHGTFSIYIEVSKIEDSVYVVVGGGCPIYNETRTKKFKALQVLATTREVQVFFSFHQNVSSRTSY
jgi:hypothetical protein